MSLAVNIESNIASAIAVAETALTRHRDHVLEIVNNTEYAQHLQARVGFWVMNDDTARVIVWSELTKAVQTANRAGMILSDAMIEQALVNAANRIVDTYQSIIGSSDSRGKAMAPPRPLHPGGWADDTVTLVRNYLSHVNDRPVNRHPYDPQRLPSGIALGADPNAPDITSTSP